jgi:hypothetical protein
MKKLIASLRNRDGLDRLAKALMAWETIDFQQVKDVIAGIDIGVPLKAEKPNVDESSDKPAPVIATTLDPILA